MTRLRTWQRALLIAAVAVVVVALADVVGGDRLTGRSTVLNGQHVVGVLADPAASAAVAPVVDGWSARSGKPVRVEWVPSATIVTRVRRGDPVDVVVVVGADELRRIRGELANQPVEVVRRGTWIAAVTDLGQPLSRAVRRALRMPT